MSKCVEWNDWAVIGDCIAYCSHDMNGLWHWELERRDQAAQLIKSGTAPTRAEARAAAVEAARGMG